MDVASSLQAVTEEIILKIAKNIHSEYNIENYVCQEVLH